MLSIFDLILRFFIFILDVSAWWDIIRLILPIRHYHGESLYMRWGAFVLLASLVLVLVFSSTLGVVLTRVLVFLLASALIAHCIVLYARSEQK